MKLAVQLYAVLRLRVLEPLLALLRQAWDINLNRRADRVCFFLNFSVEEGSPLS